MMYNEMKLEKGMYHITNKGFTEVLEELDPSAQYADTEIQGLDAYERQLKRFDIRVSGPNCDKVEKFFATTEGAVLFPEFVRRAVMAGVERSVLSEITAVHTVSESGAYLPGIFTDTEAYSTKTNQGADLPEATYLESTTALKLDKYGRVIDATYESIRKMRLDSFAVTLKSVGVKLGNNLTVQAISKLYNGASGSISKSGTSIAYTDLVNLYGQFTDFDMNTLLCSPAVSAQIMVLPEMIEQSSATPSNIVLPFGAKMYKCAGMSSNYALGLDKDFALEMITCEGLVLETDKLINNQIDRIAVSLRVNFRVITSGSVYILSLT